MESKLLVCGQLLDTDNAEVLDHEAVLVRGERIEWVKPFSLACAETGATDPSSLAHAFQADLIDLSQAFVMPGLIDAHVHIGMDPAVPMDKILLYGGFGEITVRSIKNAQADLLSGFTTLRDEGSFAYTDVDVRNLIDAGEIWGPRLKVSGQVLSSTGGHADVHYRPGVGEIAWPTAHIGLIVNGADEARRAAREVIKRGADVVKMMATGGVLSNDAAVGAPDLLFDEMSAACEIARGHGKVSSAHAHGAEGIKNAIRAGVTSVEHATLIDEEGCELAVENGTYIIPTLIAHHASVEKGRRGEIPHIYYEKAMVCEEHAAIGLTRLHGLGARIGFGTDAGTSGNPHGGQLDEFRLMMDRGGLSAMETLIAATRINAELLNMVDSVGSIADGKLADIIAFEGNPLDDIEHMKRCSFVMKGGVVYKQAGEPLRTRGV